jgi:hypothetical protein
MFRDPVAIVAERLRVLRQVDAVPQCISTSRAFGNGRLIEHAEKRHDCAGLLIAPLLRARYSRA